MVIDKLLELMAERSASDVFITIGSPIQIKLQGNVRPINQQIVTKDTIDKIVEHLLTVEQINKYRLENELNISLSRPGIGNFRVNVFKQRHNPALVIRHVPYEIPNFYTLKLPPVLAEVVLEKRGLILIVGSTGSGKSTTLAGMIDHRIASVSGHVLTVEDPIEFLFKHKKSMVNQREIGIDTESWATALKNAMRQSPDCILIGEIRDRESMAAAINYSLTGHLCISTLHANNSYHALNRINSFFPPESRAALLMDLSVALRTIISQRLIRGIDGRLLPTCELLMNEPRISDLIQKGELHEIKETMKKTQSINSYTFEQDLLRLINEGKILQEEALANCDNPADLLWHLNSASRLSAPAQENKKKTMVKNTQAAEEASFQEFQLIQGED